LHFLKKEITLPLVVLTVVYSFGKVDFAKKEDRYFNKKDFVNQAIELMRGRCLKLKNA
jgi:hypothetical protein